MGGNGNPEAVRPNPGTPVRAGKGPEGPDPPTGGRAAVAIAEDAAVASAAGRPWVRESPDGVGSGADEEVGPSTTAPDPTTTRQSVMAAIAREIGRAGTAVG